MSYSRCFQRTITVPYHGSITVSYPASERGGSQTVYYDGTAYEDVEVDIHVQTAPFDSSIADCNDHVNGLTASVGAMNIAQCAAIKKNADKVSKSIINGFFNTVRTDLQTQKAELEQIIEARLILLRQQAETLREKQQIMTSDYARTTARYQKLFADLNNELSIRVHELDQPIFKFVKEVDDQSDRMLHTDMVQTAVTMNKESGALQTQISAAAVKYHALEAMNQAQNFLVSKACSEKTIQDTCIDGSGKDCYLVPVCYMKTESENSLVERKCVIPEFYSLKDPKLKDTLCDFLDNLDLNICDEYEQIKSYVQSEIASNVIGDDDHSKRMRDIIYKMLNK